MIYLVIKHIDRGIQEFSGKDRDFSAVLLGKPGPNSDDSPKTPMKELSPEIAKIAETLLLEGYFVKIFESFRNNNFKNKKNSILEPVEKEKNEIEIEPEEIEELREEEIDEDENLETPLKLDSDHESLPDETQKEEESPPSPVTRNELKFDNDLEKIRF